MKVYVVDGELRYTAESRCGVITYIHSTRFSTREKADAYVAKLRDAAHTLDLVAALKINEEVIN